MGITRSSSATRGADATRKHTTRAAIMEGLPGNSEGLPGLSGTFSTILIDPPWRFQNRTGKMAPEHKRLHRYRTMTVEEIMAMPVGAHLRSPSHLYLWVPNALLEEGLRVMRAWGFRYKTNLVWYKVRKDGGPDGRGVGFYFRNVTELLLFGVRGSMRTLKPGARRSMFWPRGSASTRASRRRSTRSSRLAAPARTWSCSRGSGLKVGRRGATRSIATWKIARLTRRTRGRQTATMAVDRGAGPSVVQFACLAARFFFLAPAFFLASPSGSFLPAVGFSLSNTP